MALRRILRITPQQTVEMRSLHTTGALYFHQRGGGGGGRGGYGGGQQGGYGGGQQGGYGGGGGQQGGYGGGQQGGFNGGQQGGFGGGGGQQGGYGGGGGGFNGGQQGGFGGGGGQGGFGGGRGRGGNRDVLNAQQSVAESMGFDAPPAEPAAVSAKRLIDLKRTAKQGKTRKERAQARAEGFRVLSNARIDETTDERTVLTILNGAAFFKAPVAFQAVKASFDWVRANMKSLNPRNLANAAYALGAINFREREEVVTTEVLPALEHTLSGMQDVELGMTLQALGRIGLGSQADGVLDAALNILLPKANELHVTCAATLLSAVGLLDVAERNPARADEVMRKLLPPHIEKIAIFHSDVVTGIAQGLAALKRAPENAESLWGLLIDRLIQTAAQLSPNGIARVYDMLGAAIANPAFPKDVMQARVTQLLDALDKRVDYIPTYFTVEDVGDIAHALVQLNHKLPQETCEKVASGLVQFLVYHRKQNLADLGHCAEWCYKSGIVTPEFFSEIACFSVGVKTPRPLKEGDVPPPGYTGEKDFNILNEPLTDERRQRMSRRLDTFIRIRTACELALGPQASRTPALGRLAANIAESANETTPEVQMECLKTICAFPQGQSRNQQNDRMILQVIGQTVHNSGNRYSSSFTAAFLSELSASIKPQARLYPEIGQIAQMLKL